MEDPAPSGDPGPAWSRDGAPSLKRDPGRIRSGHRRPSPPADRVPAHQSFKTAAAEPPGGHSPVRGPSVR